VDGYQKGVESAKRAADDSLKVANVSLQTMLNAQDALVAQAQNALKAVQTSGVEKLALDAARATLAAYQKTEAATLEGLQSAVAGLSKTAEAVALGAAQQGLRFAMANVRDVDVARSAVELAGKGAEGIMDVGGWVVEHTVNILNVKSVDITGDFRGMCVGSSELSARVRGTFAEQAVDFSVDFLPGKGEDFVKGLFRKLMDDVKSGLIDLGKKV
jgi:hypothetical protein